jgi:hypothetical protein
MDTAPGGGDEWGATAVAALERPPPRADGDLAAATGASTSGTGAAAGAAAKGFRQCPPLRRRAHRRGDG